MIGEKLKMGFPKKKARAIHVDGENYQWLVSYQKQTSQRKILISQGQCILSHVVSDRSISAITPKLVRSLIHRGLEQGWIPTKKTKNFLLPASESLYEQFKRELILSTDENSNIPKEGVFLCVLPSFYDSDREWPFLSIPFEVAHFRFCGDVNDKIIGTFFANIASGNSELIPKESNQEQVLSRILYLLSHQENRWLKEGGVCFVVDGTFTLSFGCCSDWDEWHTWVSLLTTGQTTGWNGHDPESYAERRGDIVLFIEDGDEVSSHSITDYQKLVKDLHQDIQDFILKVLAWLAQRVSIPDLELWEKELYRLFHLNQ